MIQIVGIIAIIGLIAVLVVMRKKTISEADSYLPAASCS